MRYGYTKKVPHPFADAIVRLREELSKEGFGILTEIDVQATLKKKLDVEYEKYLILGACNPSFAYRALQREKELGLLLPCNVVVYVQDGTTHIAAVLPSAMMSVVENEKLAKLGEEVEEKLTRAINRAAG